MIHVYFKIKVVLFHMYLYCVLETVECPTPSFYMDESFVK